MGGMVLDKESVDYKVSKRINLSAFASCAISTAEKLIQANFSDKVEIVFWKLRQGEIKDGYGVS